MSERPVQVQESDARSWSVYVDSRGAMVHLMDPWDVHPPVEAVEVVPRSEAEALAEALDKIRRATGMYGAAPQNLKRIAREALAEYRSCHPKETL